MRPDLLPPVRPRLTPAQGSPLGGDVVTVTNVAASADTTVTFNAVPALQVTATGPRELRVVTPPGTGDVPVAITNPGPAGPVVTDLNFGYTELTVSVVRPDDLLTLQFELVNLTLTPDGGSLERRDTSVGAFVIVHFPAQHIAEVDFDVTAGSPAPPPIGAALAGPSRLVFAVPAATETLPLDLSALLDWTAFVAAGPTGAVGSPIEPTPRAASIELPYRMLLTPAGSPRWKHVTSAPQVGNDEAVEVWRTTASDPGLRLTWSPELANRSDPGAVTFGHPTPGQRAELAAQAPALDSVQLVLSPLGASVDFRAALADTGAVTGWRQVVADGRDTYVRLVTRGVLAPFGHAASIATVVERHLASASDGTPVEALQVTKILVVTQPDVDYSDLQDGHPVLPFRSVRIQTGTTPPISSSDEVVGQVTVPGGPYPFHLVAEDLNGTSIDLTMPLVFVPEGLLGAGANSLDGQYGQFANAADLRGQTVAFVPKAPAAPAAELAPRGDPADDPVGDGASLAVTAMTFKLVASTTGAPFVPELATAQISLPGADAVAGPIGSWAISYHDAYRHAGFDPTANVGQVFAQVIAIAPIVLGVAADRGGGLAAPALNVDGLSRSLGPVARSADLALGSFIPEHCLPVGAQLLGGLKLADFLAPLTGAAFDPARLPALLRTPISSGVQTSFTWSPQLARDPATVTVGPLVVDLTTAALQLTNVSTAYVDGRPPSSVVDGTLTSVTFTFLDAARLMAFHHVPPAQAGASPGPVVDPVAPDFHAVLTALLDYPHLLRRLGLVVDLQVPLGALPQASIDTTSPPQLRLVPSLAAGEAVLPWTAFVRDGDQIFAPAASDSAAPEAVARLLDLSQPDAFDLIQVDIDSATLKALTAVQTGVADPDASATLPSLRTTGLTLTRSDYGVVLSGRMAAAAANEDAAFGPTPTPVVLHAEDLIRGLRLDVRDEKTGTWMSLHRRVGTYTVAGAPVLVDAVDEGASQPSASHLPDVGASASPLRVHDALVRWEGWSLSVARPGATVTDDGAERIVSTAGPGGIPLTVAFDAEPGSLPRLRYGRQYQLRARAVDLAGNSPSVAEADDLLDLLSVLRRAAPVLPAAAPGLPFRRFEPVGSPLVVQAERSTEGESVERVVIRSDRDEDAAACGRRLSALPQTDPGSSGLRYLAVSERHLAPPKAAQLDVERAGLLDALADDAAYALSRKEKGRLSDSSIVDVTTGLPVPIPDTVDVDPVTGTVGVRPAIEPVSSGASSFTVHHEPQLVLPYLPDPFSVGATLCGLPGQPLGSEASIDDKDTLVSAPWTLDPASLAIVGSTAAVGFDGTWPQTRPFRLSLAEGVGAPGWNANDRVLTSFLPKGRQATVRLSSFLPPDALGLLGIWSWVVDDRIARGLGPPSAVDAELALRGLTWLLTPFRQLTLVHAVQRPLTDPALTNLTAVRAAGTTATGLVADIAVDVPSTARLDLLARWTETVDDLSLPGQVTTSMHAHVVDTSVPPTADVGQLGDGVLHLGQLAGPVPHPPPGPHPPPVPHPPPGPKPQSGLDPSSPPPLPEIARPPAGTTVTADSDTAPDTGRSRQEFGDTKHRRVTYQAVATTAFREYFPAELDPASMTVIGAEVEIDVPSSARPPAPVVRAAIPMYHWDRPVDSSSPRRRHSAGVRLLLERPWLASGDGEQLAVVLAGPGRYPPMDELRPYVTEWGNDPIWGGNALDQPPRAESFPTAVGVSTSVPLAEADPVDLVAHAVTYDPARQVWVCDIPIDVSDAYLPFVRLAVARYQPSSIPGVELSRVVLAPPVQILPERRVAVSGPTAADPDTVTIRVDGVSFRSSGLPDLPDPSGEGVLDIEGIDPIPDLVQVCVQQRLPGTTDDAGWRPVSGELAAVVQIDSAVSAAGLATMDPTTPLWTGRVSLPPDRAAGQLRILITENQVILSDLTKLYSWIERTDPGEFPPGHPPGPVFTHHQQTYNPGSPRLIFAETIDL